ncbi:MAG: redoxin domain-containing protein [Candidatus Thermoplasmatota archaeon]|nr:redoxin domain-containing protein [Candidatus Thermoplasmatota archaeon]
MLLIGALIFSSLPAKAELILDVSHSPEVPLPGVMVNVTVRVADPSNISFVQIFWCNFDSGSCYPNDMYYGGNDTYWRGIGGEENIINGTVIGYNVTVENTTGHRDYYPEATKYVNITYVGPSPPAKPAPPLITLELVLVEALLIGITVALLGILAWRKMNGLETSKVAAMGVVILIILAVVYGAVTILTRPTEVELAKDFQAVDTDGYTFNLSDFRGEVVILDFMSISCGGCEIIAGTIIDDVYPHFDESELEVISIDVLDDLDSLRAFKEDKGYPWRMAMDPGGLVNDYAVSSIPKLVVIDREGYAVNVVTDAYASASSIRGMIDSALAGRSQAIGIQAVGGILLAVFAGFATFFSPCSFPMLPGFVAYYLSAEAEQEKKSTLKVLGSGLVAGIGIILVFLVIGFVWIAAGTAANVEEYTPILGPIVGAVLIALGLLMFTNLQYHALLRPFTRLKEAITKGKSKETGGYYPKLFGYGVGYGAAASACTAPLFIAVLAQSSITGGPTESLFILLVFSLVIVLLMVAITFMLSAFGQESVRKLSQYTDLIKKVSAVVLIAVGVYLIYYYFTSHII